MTILYLLLLVGACICFGVAAAGARGRNPHWGSYLALGLLLFALVPTIQTLVRID